MPAQRLKHVYSAITIASNDLATVAWHWGRLTEPVLRANAYHLQRIEELAEVVREDQVVDTLSIVATSGQRWLSFAYQPGYVLIEASDADPALLDPFTAVADLLAAKPKNGFAQCLLELSPPGTWHAPELVGSGRGDGWLGRAIQRVSQLVRGPRPA
jgi:hypothetical protein